MLQYKKVKSGFILVYVLLVGSLSLIMVLISFKLNMQALKNSESIYDSSLEIQPLEEEKEFLFTQLSDYIYSNLNSTGVSHGNIVNLFSPIAASFEIVHKKSLISYNVSKDTFQIESYYDPFQHREDTYSYVINDDKVSYKYMDTTYCPGEFSI